MNEQRKKHWTDEIVSADQPSRFPLIDWKTQSRESGPYDSDEKLWLARLWNMHAAPESEIKRAALPLSTLLALNGVSCDYDTRPINGYVDNAPIAEVLFRQLNVAYDQMGCSEKALRFRRTRSRIHAFR